MGNSQSSRAIAQTTAPLKEQFHRSSESVGGRKSTTEAIQEDTSDFAIEMALTDTEDSDESNNEEEESDEEIEAGLMERRQILEDAKLLKKFAEFHLHPEKCITTTDPFAKGRNYFQRASAPDTETREESEERARILNETKLLKQYATFHLHPENPVETTDATVCARSYFSRPSAPDQVTVEEAEERVAILKDALALKMYADFHLHPEKPVQTTDAAAFGRNYFGRASAAPYYDEEEAEEREEILAEAAMLKQYATFHLHPENPVTTSDASAYGRNYYSRPSADEYFDEQKAEERERILAECQALKTHADYHLHPEKPVAVEDPKCFGRNYFSRASAPEQMSVEDAEERARVLEETALLKQYAQFHLHPEKPVVSIDSTICGRNYFTRASAPEYLDEDEADERDRILAECKALKTYAGYHLHPERPVEITDATLTGRNYYNRYSAPEQMSVEDAEERARILQEAAELKKYADYHLHPEKPVVSSDPMACGRNYFTRASAPEYLDEDEADERDAVLADCQALKKYAGYHLHPERPVENLDPATFGRNYYGRASAPAQETFAEAEERAKILEEAAMLKTFAQYHLHPEKPVVSSNATCHGRNYFMRASAPEQESPEEAEERNKILQEVAMLKKFAGYHLHPEKPVETSDPTAFGRNFFNRPSAPEQETLEEAEERVKILEETQMLKKYADFHLHPEKPVESSDSFACGRNYFSRYSAPEYFGKEEAEERERILEECQALKKTAEYHLHPEKPVESTDYSGRNYFSRPSAPEYLSQEDAEERERVLAECAALKKHAEFHLHPEKPVETTDPTACGRNYFSRASAVLPNLITSEGRTFSIADESFSHRFEFEEELTDLDHFRASLSVSMGQRLQAEVLQPLKDGDAEEEGKLSRSPSSIMLFGMESGEAY